MAYRQPIGAATRDRGMKMAKHGEGKSPYQKYGKTPFRYSSEIIEWRQAIIKKNEGDARKFARAFSMRLFGIDMSIPHEREMYFRRLAERQRFEA